MHRHASRLRSLLLGGILLVGCHAGDIHGSGTSCDEASPCRAPLVCVAGSCQLLDGAVDTGTETASDVSSPDSPGDAHGTDAIDATGDATDGAVDSPDGTGNATDVAVDAIEDASDGADPSQDAADGPGPDGALPDGMPDAPSPDTGSPSDAGPPGDPNHPAVLHVFATTDTGGLWLLSAPVSSLRGPVGNIANRIDVSARAGSMGSIDDVEAQAIGNEVNALARKGSNVFATSVIDQTWTPWVKVAGDVSAMALANVTGKLWACLADSAGRLRLTVRQGDGWHDLGDVMDEASLPLGLGDAPAALAKLDCAGVGDDLEIFALDRLGDVWHATKTATRWIQFRRVEVTSHLDLRDIDVCNAVGEMHVLVSSQTTQYHGILDSVGVWSRFGDIQLYIDKDAGVANAPGDILAGAETAILAEVDWLQVTSFGEIWLSPRFRYLLRPYERYIDQAPDGARFVTASATSVLPY